MSGIYITGMEMPKEGNETILRLMPDGTVLDQYGHHLALKAIPVPKHGRLKDYDQIMKEYNEWFSKAESRQYENMFYALYRAINDARTIVPSR